MVKKFFGVIAILGLFVFVGCATPPAQPPFKDIPAVNQDHCLTGLRQTFESGSISSPINTSLIAPVTGLNIYVCSYVIDQAGGASTSLQFSYGTGATCGTGNQTLGTLYTANTSAGTAANIIVGNGSATVLSTDSPTTGMVVSQRLCATSVGSTVQSVGGTFVQE
jgi:hypothetical protein